MEQTWVRIGGVPTTGEVWDDVVSPYDGQLVARVPRCGPREVEDACSAAGAALRARTFPPGQRADVLEQVGRLLAERRDEYARTIAMEAGAPVRRARCEVDAAAATLRLAAGQTGRPTEGALSRSRAAVPGGVGFVLRTPAGVAAVLTPSSRPLETVARAVGPAVAAGCPVVLKPSARAPLVAIRLVELLVEAGAPVEWVSVVTGPGPEVGASLVSHPVPRVVIFSGCVRAAAAVAKRAAAKRVLVSHDRAVVTVVEPDADLRHAAARLGRLGRYGPPPIQRVLVHESVSGAFLDVLVEVLGSLTTGDPLDPTTDVGPAADPRAVDRTAAAVAATVDGGARLVAGGETRGGALVPTVLTGVPPDAPLLWEAGAAPVVAVDAYDCLERAVETLDAEPPPAQIGVFTQRVDAALQLIWGLRSGDVLLNDVPAPAERAFAGPGEWHRLTAEVSRAVGELTELRYVHIAA